AAPGSVDDKRRQSVTPFQRAALEIQVLHTALRYPRLRTPHPPAAQGEAIVVQAPMGVAVMLEAEPGTERGTEQRTAHRVPPRRAETEDRRQHCRRERQRNRPRQS